MNAPQPKLLIVAPNWIGDALMAQPLLALIKQRYPTAQIDVLAPAWVAPVFHYMAEVNQVIPTQFAHGKLQWWERMKCARQLQAQHYHAAYVLPNSFKSALIPWLARIPIRIGYKGEARVGLLTLRHPSAKTDKKIPMVEHYAALAVKPGKTLSELLPEGVPNPKISVSPAEVIKVCEQFQISPQRPLVAFCPGAEYGPAKRWPASHFAQLAKHILQTFPYAQIVALGGPKDKEIVESICQVTPQVQNLCGATQLPQAIALLARADTVVCNDSGLMHIRAALDRPLIAIFGSSDPRHTPPHTDRADIFWLQLECSPCFARECPLGHLRCLNDISAEMVFATLRRQLSLATSSTQTAATYS